MSTNSQSKQLRKRGRPKRKEKLQKVWLRNSTYKLWKEKKIAMGYSTLTNSEFAEVLLHSDFKDEERRVVKKRRLRSDLSLPLSPISKLNVFLCTKVCYSIQCAFDPERRPLFTSTPQQIRKRHQLSASTKQT